MDKKATEIEDFRILLERNKAEIVHLKKITLYVVALMLVANAFSVFFLFKMITTIFGTSVIVLSLYLLFYYIKIYALEDDIDNLKSKIYQRQKL